MEDFSQDKGDHMFDWRLTNQSEYLLGKTFCLKKYQKRRDDWEHDHCEFCNKKISEKSSDENYGYSTIDEYYWVCKDCFEDFKEIFHWTVKNDPPLRS